MNVWEYLDRHGQRDNVVNCIDTLLPTNWERHEMVIKALKTYSLVINHRAKGRFGCVKHGKLTMELTSEFFASGYSLHPERVDEHMDTLLHETAHIIVDIAYRKGGLMNGITTGRRIKSHGPEWKRVMRLLGARPERCGKASFLKEAREAKGHKHEYTCQGCGHVYKTNRVLKNIEHRFHGKCGRIEGRLTHRQLR